MKAKLEQFKKDIRIYDRDQLFSLCVELKEVSTDSPTDTKKSVSFLSFFDSSLPGSGSWDSVHSL